MTTKCCKCNGDLGNRYGLDFSGNAYCSRKLCKFNIWLKKKTRPIKLQLIGIIQKAL